MGPLGDSESLTGLVEAINRYHGPVLAEKFAFANAHGFLSAQLPLSA